MNLTQSEILAKLQDIFRTQLVDDKIKIDLDTTRDNMHYWDSLAQIQIIDSVANEFDINIPTYQIEEINSVRQLIDLILVKR